VHLVRVGGKVHQRPLLELEQWRTRVAVFLVLFDCVAPALTSPWIFQLAGGHWQAVNGKHQIDGGVIAGMTRHLSGHRQTVGLILRQHLFIQAMSRFEVGQP
jgi:hypothetical protein